MARLALTCNLLLRITSYITADHGQTYCKAYTLAAAQPQSDKSSPFLVFRYCNKCTSRSDANQIATYHDNASHSRNMRADVAADQ